MTRRTSIKAYQTIKENNLLSKRRLEVYEHLFSHGPITSNDLIHHFFKLKVANSGGYTTRLSELRDMGAIYEVGTTICKYTGHKVLLWDVTENLPTKLKREKRIPRKRLEHIRQVLVEVYTHKELPNEIKKMIEDRLKANEG